MIMSVFSERLKELRKSLGLTEEELADLASTRTNTIFRYESGRSSPKRESLEKLAEALNTTTSYLLGETDNPLRAGRPTVRIIDSRAVAVDDNPNQTRIEGNTNIYGIQNNGANQAVSRSVTDASKNTPWWLDSIAGAYETVANKNTQELEEALNGLKFALGVLERAQAVAV